MRMRLVQMNRCAMYQAHGIHVVGFPNCCDQEAWAGIASMDEFGVPWVFMAIGT